MLMRRCEEKRNEELRSTEEEGLPRLKEERFGEGSEKLQGCHGAGGMGQGAVTLVLDLAKTCERASLTRCVGLDDAFQFSQEDSAGLLWLFRAQTTG